MSRKLVVSKDGLAKRATTYKIAVGGVVKAITKAMVAHEGVVRQYWPDDTPPDPPPARMFWGTDPINIIQSEIDPLDCQAIIGLDRAAGICTYNNHPSVNVNFIYMNPPLGVSETGLYLVKMDQLTGTIVGSLGTWIDLASVDFFTWHVAQTVVGEATATGNMSMAVDDGFGAPETGTIEVRPLTFSATVTPSGDGLAWTTAERTLYSATVAVDAVCELQFMPTGIASGIAMTFGSFTESWHTDDPLVEPAVAATFDVRVNVISGDALDGSSDATGTDLPLDSFRSWTLTSVEGEDKTTVLDVIVTNTISMETVTKRVNMRSVYLTDDPQPLPIGDWTLTDEEWPQAKGELGEAVIRFEPTGLCYGKRSNDNSPPAETQGSGEWSPVLPPDNPENYEVKLEAVGFGGNVEPPMILGEWYTLDQVREWTIPVTTIPRVQTHLYRAYYRVFGGVSQTIDITIIVGGDDGSTPP